MSETCYPSLYACEQWEVDLGRGELRRSGAPVPIGNRAFQIIEVLVRSGSDLVTKDQLIQHVWPRIAVNENTLHVHIAAVRKALGHDRNLLKTTQGRGYRLLGNWMPRHQTVVETPPAAARRHTSPISVPTNFPALATRLIGRAEAVQRIRDLVSAYRAVTLTGPGGIGKTVLAIKTGRRLIVDFDHGAWFVALASLSDPDLVPAAVASTLELKVGGKRVTAESLARALSSQHLLLVLDNCEHLIDAVASLVETMLRHCPRTTVLVTSREIMRIQGEAAYRVPALDIPAIGQDAPDTILGHSAIELFISRTTALGAAIFPDREELRSVAEICRRLDGLPLAIEFAAARAAFLGTQQVAAGLRDRFALLTSGRHGAMRRHRTLRATLDWSYDLLPETEQLLFRHLAVFPAGFTIDAVAAVMQDDCFERAAVTEGIANLVAKSLVAFDKSAPTSRWSLLETIRTYCLEKLAKHDELDRVARRQAAYFANLFARPAPGSSSRFSDADWARRVREIDNVRAALDWSFSPRGDRTLGIDLTAAYAPVWLNLSLMGECRARCEQALHGFGPGLILEKRVQMWLQIALGMALISTMGSADQARTIMTEALEAGEALDDFEAQAWALVTLSNISLFRGEYDKATITGDRLERIADRLDDPSITRAADRIKGITLLNIGRLREAQWYLERSLQSQPLAGHGHSVRFPSDHSAPNRALLARALWLQGSTKRAYEEAHASIDEVQSTDYALLICIALFFGVCRFAPFTGDFALAERLVKRLIDIATSLNADFWRTVGQLLQGKLLVECGEYAQAVELLRDGLEVCRRTGWRVSYPEFQASLAAALLGLGRPDAALDATNEGLARAAEHGDRWYVAELLRIKGEVLLKTGPDTTVPAEDCFVKALRIAREQQALSWELRIALSLARLLTLEGRHDEARQVLATVYKRFSDDFETTDLRAARAFLDAPT